MSGVGDGEYEARESGRNDHPGDRDDGGQMGVDVGIVAGIEVKISREEMLGGMDTQDMRMPAAHTLY